MRRVLCGSLLLSLCAVAQAHAQFEAGVGIGHYDWSEQTSASQQEDTQLFSLILGIESHDVALKGWSGGGGVRLPLVIREDAHFDQVGFSTNPTLEPGRQASVRGSLRYRFSPHLSCTGS